MANDFSGASDCVALYNVDQSTGILTDSKNGNTLTNTGSTPLNEDAKQGDRSADFTVNGRYLLRTDGNLSDDFPGKNGTTNLSLTACFWAKQNGLGNNSFIGKWDGNNSFLALLLSGVPCLAIMTTGGQRIHTAGGSCFTDRWYHHRYSYDGGNDAWTIRVWDDTAQAFSNNGSGTVDGTMITNTSDLQMGSAGAGSSNALMDEIVIFNTVRSVADTDAIRAGTFNEPGGGETLTIQDGLIAHIVDNVVLTQKHNLTVADGLIAHTADNVVIAQKHILAILDGLIGHNTDNVVITQKHTLAILDGLIAHTADNLTLTQGITLAIQDGLFGHTADNLTLTQRIILAIQDGLFAHTADNLDLIQAHILIIDDGLFVIIGDQCVFPTRSTPDTIITSLTRARRITSYTVTRKITSLTKKYDITNN